MDGTTLEERLAQVRQREGLIVNYLNGRKIDDSTGWGTTIETLIYDMEGQAEREKRSGTLSDRPCGLLLTGPDGCGKHTAMHRTVQILSEKGWGFAFLDGRDLPDFTAAKELINALLDGFYDESKPLCLVLENLSEYGERRALMNYLETTVYDYWFNQSDLPPLFTVIIGGTEDIPKLLGDRLFICRFTLPDSDARSRYFAAAAADIADYAPVETLTELSGGLTFTQMRALVGAVTSVIDRAGGVSRDAVRDIVRQMLPPPRREDLLAELIDRLDSFAERLPELIANIKPAQTAVQQTPQPIPQLPINMTDQQREEIYGEEARKTRDMPVRDLAADLWGERANELIRK